MYSCPMSASGGVVVQLLGDGFGQPEETRKRSIKVKNYEAKMRLF